MTTTEPCHVLKYYVAFDHTTWIHHHLPILCEHLEMSSDTPEMIADIVSRYVRHSHDQSRLPAETSNFEILMDVLNVTNMDYVDPSEVLVIMENIYQTVKPSLDVITRNGPLESLRCVMSGDRLTAITGGVYSNVGYPTPTYH